MFGIVRHFNDVCELNGSKFSVPWVKWVTTTLSPHPCEDKPQTSIVTIDYRNLWTNYQVEIAANGTANTLKNIYIC